MMSSGMNTPEPQLFAEALAVAQSWLGRVPGIVAVGEGEQGGEPTIDVWVTSVWTPPLPDELAPMRVRVRSSGGPVEVLDDGNDRP